MGSEKINELLEKYWNGETSLEEEELLHAYFGSAFVPESMKEAASLFRYFAAQRDKKLMDPSFDSKVTKSIRKGKSRQASLVYNSMRIAAGIVVLVLSIWLVRMEVRESDPVESTDTYNDPKVAFEETKKALMMISRSFGAAEQQAKKINVFNEAKENLQKDDPRANL